MQVISKSEKEVLESLLSKTEKGQYGDTLVGSTKIKQYLQSIVEQRELSAPIYLKGLPIPTTEDGIDTISTQKLILGAAQIFGSPYIQEGHRSKSFVYDLRPKREDSAEQLGTGTDLRWHTDDAHAKIPPRGIVLLCLQGDSEAKTLVSKSCDELDSDVQRKLRSESFTIIADKSYRERTTYKGPIISNNEIALRYDPSFTDCSKEEGELLQQLEEYFNSHHSTFCMESGDLLIIDNWKRAHARTKFTPRYDNTDRWVQRVIIN